ncbi:hypothetical protein ONZ43_g5823 [Nemania bipapillata]|uniref:Uncharacterized protein n=1 Tax=Nemania bipapillata TaxID=110536 RepID=A0ACC2I5K0_9PEZI|nr:hypothetical protein ONZ43_g5823 [Nemania bipapillata]
MDLVRLLESFESCGLIMIPSLFMVLGIYMFLRCLYRFARSLYIYDLLYSFNIYRQTSRFNDYTLTKDLGIPYALITNAGTELGRNFAEKLAGLGFNLVLQDAALHEVTDLQSKLGTKYPFRKFHIMIISPKIVYDNRGMLASSRIQEAMQDYTLKVLVNIAYPRPSTGEKHNPRHVKLQFTDVIYGCVTLPTLMLTSATERLATCAPSLILNVEAPDDSDLETALVGAGCRAYLRRVTVDLAREMKALGADVEVLDLNVGPISGIRDIHNGVMKKTPFRPTIDNFVLAALARVGCGEKVLAPCWQHAFMGWCVNLAPVPIMEWLRIKILRRRIHQSMRPR